MLGDALLLLREGCADCGRWRLSTLVILSGRESTSIISGWSRGRRDGPAIFDTWASAMPQGDQSEGDGGWKQVVVVGQRKMSKQTMADTGSRLSHASRVAAGCPKSQRPSRSLVPPQSPQSPALWHEFFYYGCV